MTNEADRLRAQILELVRQYHGVAFPARPFVPGQSTIPYAGRVFDDDELATLADCTLDFWLTTGASRTNSRESWRSNSACAMPC